jgi:hypothetical protein
MQSMLQLRGRAELWLLAQRLASDGVSLSRAVKIDKVLAEESGLDYEEYGADAILFAGSAGIPERLALGIADENVSRNFWI